MGMNADGTATCNNCGAQLPGYGVINGLMVQRVNQTTGKIEQMIFCYLNGCSDKVLRGNLNH
jgi:hypothetical protein